MAANICPVTFNVPPLITNEAFVVQIISSLAPFPIVQIPPSIVNFPVYVKSFPLVVIFPLTNFTSPPPVIVSDTPNVAFGESIINAPELVIAIELKE